MGEYTVNRSKHTGRYSIKTVIITTISLLLVVSVAVSLLWANELHNQARAVREERYISNMKTISNNLNWRIGQAYYKLIGLASDDDIHNFVYDNFVNFIQIKNQCNQILNYNTDIEEILFISAEKQYQIFLNEGVSASTVQTAEIIENVGDFKPYGIVGLNSKKLVLCRPIQDFDLNECVGYVVFVLSNDIFYEEMRFAQMGNLQNYVVTSSSTPSKMLVRTGFVKLPENWLSENSGNEYRFKTFENDGESYSTIQFTSKYGITVCYIIPSSALAPTAPTYLWIGVGLLGCVLVVVFAFIIRLFVLMSASFGRLDDTLEKIEQFDADRLEQMLDIKEFYYIAQRVYAVSDRMAQLNYETLAAQKEVLQKEVAKRNALLVALKNQINPHFIYNTLACVKQQSAVGRNESVAEICDRMVWILRYSIQESVTAKVYEELEMLKSYLYIQNLRFEQDILYKIDVDQALLDCDMVRFILQPIIENSITHGILSEGRIGKITVSGVAEDEKIVFRVSDSGAGMAPEVLKALQKKLSAKGNDTDFDTRGDGHGIGLVNINNRIKLFYGDEYGLKISSILNVGTFVTVEFPRSIKREAQEC